MLLLFQGPEIVVEPPEFVEATTPRTDHSVACFDGRVFDSAAFDCLAPRIRPTLGGWEGEQQTTPHWAPNDLGRGTQWNKKPRGNSTW
jgi:hypothetical protein